MPRQIKPHGTNAAYQRHIKAGQKACEACQAAHAVYSYDHKHGNIPERVPADCGTLSGYNAHRYRKDQACQPCLDAHAKYARDRRAKVRQAKAERAAALEAAWAEVLVEAGVV